MRTMIITDGSALSKLYNVVYRSLEFASRSVFTDWQNMVNIKKWETLYGGFEHTDFTPYRIALPNESGGYAGEIVKWAKELNPKPDRALLSGESNEVKLRLSFLGNVVHTAGLFNADSVDFVWNFEEDPPSNIAL